MTTLGGKDGLPPVACRNLQLLGFLLRSAGILFEKLTLRLDLWMRTLGVE